MRKGRGIRALFLLFTLFLVSAQPVLARVPNDPYFNDQWYLGKISAPGAWNETVGGNKGIIVAVLDTAIDLRHPDLSDNVYVNTNEIAGNGIDDDKNGFIDDVKGWDFVDNDADVSPDAESVASEENDISLAHGTFIAGIIGAETNNNVGYAGIVWNARVMPLRILNEEGGGTETAAARAVDYAVKNGAKVINLSFAGDHAGAAFKNSIRRAYEAGVVVVAALGNSARDVNVTPVYPACLQSETADWVIGVSATDINDEETYFTNFGDDCADLSAPGEDIFGLRFGDNGGDSLSGSQISWSGTSAASPMVAGAAALLLSLYPSLSPSDVRVALKLSVDPIVVGPSGRGALGVGRLNIERALSVAASIAKTAPEPVPQEEETADDFVDDDSFTQTAHLSYVAVGANKGSAPWVKVYKANGEPYAEFLAYGEGFLGGISVAVQDLDNDGIPEIITGTGDGGGPHVRVFTAFGALRSQFFAYDEASRHGVRVAVADTDGDHEFEIVTAVGAGVSNDVITWTPEGKEKSRFTASGFDLNAPLTATAGDVDDDYESEMIVAALKGTPRIAIYQHDGKPLVDFLAYAPNMGLGMSLDVGDFDHDQRDEIVVSPLYGAPGHIRIFNKIGALFGEFFITEQSSRAGARVSVTDINVDGTDDIVIIPAGEKGEVKVFGADGELLSIVGSNLIPSNGAALGAW
jgi:hypothetical protein